MFKKRLARFLAKFAGKKLAEKVFGKDSTSESKEDKD